VFFVEMPCPCIARIRVRGAESFDFEKLGSAASGVGFNSVEHGGADADPVEVPLDQREVYFADMLKMVVNQRESKDFAMFVADGPCFHGCCITDIG